MKTVFIKLDKKRAKIIDNDKGFVLILSMVMLSILSILGIMALNTTNTELGITTNFKTNSDTFVASELVTEYAKQKVISSPGSVGTSYDFVEDDDDAPGLLPANIEFEETGRNEIIHYTSAAPSAMANATSTDAYLTNIYRSGDGSSTVSEGEAAYYRVSVSVKGPKNSSSRIETLFVNRGGQVF